MIGTWRDDMKVNQEEWKAYVGRKGRQHVIDNIITRCPTKALALKGRRLAGRQQQGLRALHALPQRRAEGAAPRRRQGRDHSYRWQAHAEDR